MKDIRGAQEKLVRAVAPGAGVEIPTDRSLGHVLMNEFHIAEDGTVSVGVVGAAGDLRLITPALWATLRAFGIESVTVKQQPRAKVLRTGSAAGSAAADFLQSRLGQINAQCDFQEFSGSLERPDVIALVETCDALIIIGGEREEIFEALRQKERELMFSNLEMQPGGTAFAFVIDGVPVIWCEDNAADLIVVSELFLVPALISRQQLLKEFSGALKAELRSDIDLEQEVTLIVPGLWGQKNGVFQVRPVKDWQERGAMAYTVADCLIIGDPEQFVLDRHSIVDMIPMNRGLE